MLTSAQLGLDLAELGPHPLFAGVTPQHEPSGARVRADVREPEELEWFGFSCPARLSVTGGKSPELDQPRLAGVQLQAELREPVAKICEESLGVLTVLEPGDVVTRSPVRS
jgi:hypothetical protein